MGAPLRQPTVVGSPIGARDHAYSLNDLGELVPVPVTPSYLPIFGNNNNGHDLAAKTPPRSPFYSEEGEIANEAEFDEPAPLTVLAPRQSQLQASSGSMIGSKVGSSDLSHIHTTRTGSTAYSGTLSPGHSALREHQRQGSTASFRTLHASAKGLLRTHPVATEHNLYEAFCGRKITQMRKSVASRNTKLFARASTDLLVEEPLDWVMAIAVPAPGVRKFQDNITEAHAQAIFRSCFKGEEYENATTAFSLQSEAAATELRAFMNAFKEMPDTDGREGKLMNVGRRQSREDMRRNYSDSTEGTDDEDSPEYKKVPRSFTCLVRNAIVAKLMLHCGLRVKLIPSEDHQQIILLISCSHYELLREADRQSLPTELDVYAADPESLEPCTETMIPLLYWFHSSISARDVDEDAPFREALQTLIAKRREILDGLPQRGQAFHQNATEFWETLRGENSIANWESSMANMKKLFKFSNESFSAGLSYSLSSRTWTKEDADPVPHFGSKDNAKQAKDGFMEYLKAKVSEPLGRPDELQKEVNRERVKKGYQPLRNYYEQLGVDQISAHAGFEVGTYLGAGQSTQCLWRHFSVRVAPPQPGKEKVHGRTYEKHIATPFRNHQIIKLIVDIISRQMDIGRLIDLGLVNSMFPLDSRDKVEEPESWVVQAEQGGQEYWFNVDTKQVSRDVPSDIMEPTYQRPPSSLIKAWGYPPKDLPTLQRGWLFFHSFFVWPPVQKVRDYYGEEIALYFALTQHLTWWCVVPAVLGVFTGIMEPLYGGKIPLAYIHLVYGILISCWGSLWLESWKRREAHLAATWGLLGISEQEVLRPAFEGVSRRSPIDFDNDMDRVEAFCCRYGRVGRFPRQLVSALCLFFLALVHNVLMVLLLTFRGTWVENGWWLFRYSNVGVAAFFAIQMTLFSLILYRICVLTNNWENYRTHADYTRAFIIKQCGLEFVNQFAIFFYIGLVKGAVDGCIVLDAETNELARTPKIDISTLDNIDKAMCSQELRDAVKNVLLAFAFMNVIEITLPAFILPKLRSTIKEAFSPEEDPELRRKGTAEEQRFIGWTMSKIVQAMLNKEVYSTVEASGTYDDYIEIMVFFGHVSMFSLVFPFCPLIVMVLLVIEIRVDGHKLFHTLRRPLPKNAGSIGAWHYIFQFITWVSVVTNALILSWGMEDNELHWLQTSSTATKWLFTVCLVLGLVIFKAVIIVGVPDVPGPLKTLLLHHEWVCQQLSSNNVAIGPRHMDITKLDTHIHSAFSEQRTFSVDFAVTGSEWSNSSKGRLS